MSHLQYYSYPGMGAVLREKHGYNQAVRLGDRIECAGQGGWDTTTGEISQNIREEIEQAFKNIDVNLRDAGGKGWSQVCIVKSYHTDMSMEYLEIMIENFKKWMPDHQPIWTTIGVTALGMPEMHVEIDVTACDEEGAAKAKAAKA